jgi:hypothetical protein
MGDGSPMWRTQPGPPRAVVVGIGAKSALGRASSGWVHCGPQTVAVDADQAESSEMQQSARHDARRETVPSRQVARRGFRVAPKHLQNSQIGCVEAASLHHSVVVGYDRRHRRINVAITHAATLR